MRALALESQVKDCQVWSTHGWVTVTCEALRDSRESKSVKPLQKSFG